MDAFNSENEQSSDTNLDKSEQSSDSNSVNQKKYKVINSVHKVVNSVGLKTTGVIFPDNKWIRYWDILICLSLLTLLFVIPYQVGVTSVSFTLTNTTRIVFSSIIDFIFIVDTILYFWRAYREPDGRLVFDLKKIRRHYLRTFFVWNLLGSIPSAIIFAGQMTPEEDFSLEAIIVSRVFDLLKLFRLARVPYLLRSSDFVVQFQQNQKSQAKLALVKYTFLLIVASHLLACSWCFLAFVQAGNFGDGLLERNNWILFWYNNNYEEGMINPIGEGQNLDRYILSMFWSIQTITSIGYGNISPFTRLEWWFGSIFMLLSGVLWAYIIGSLVGVAAALQVENELHRNRIDEVNVMISQFAKSDPTKANYACEQEMYDTDIFAKRLKNFIHSQKLTHKLSATNDMSGSFPVINSLSPEMQRVSCFMLVREHLELVPYLSSRFLNMHERSRVAKECMVLDFPPGETIRMSEDDSSIGRGIFVMIRGTAFATHGVVKSFSQRRRKAFVITAGQVFGAGEVLLSEGNVQSEGRIEVISFTRVLFIPRRAVLAALERNQKAWKDCARWKYFLAITTHLNGNDKAT
mmetsp:Transcript_49400/g.74572  ORF Transcript_49400/g.74572 Transcript_49400/m.74572 type:complete len:577 (-) Transcript_49400:272-2002(-)